jgi:hypothetical protein
MKLFDSAEIDFFADGVGAIHHHVRVRMRDTYGQAYQATADGWNSETPDVELSNLECQARCLDQIARALRRQDSACPSCRGTGGRLP